MAEQDFNFEGEFALLDIGATSSLLRVGSLRPTVLAFTASASVESVALDWDPDAGPSLAFEEARRFVRSKQAVAYAVIALADKTAKGLAFLLPGAPPPNREVLAVAMFAEDGNGRGLCYPVRRVGTRISFGMPEVSDGETTDWCPIGDPWLNPFCIGDTVQLKPRERAVDPSTPLWHTIVELTRLRIHADQDNAEYMEFLDDLRNGIFLVVGRPMDAADRVLLRPRTVFNPVGTLSISAGRLVPAVETPANVEEAGAR